ncbi:MAG: hypothetical protein HKO58_10255 [Gammaproteobacteria bacterium]|nr:hypothetical protein [Gammaproteobacteria bacterium]
MKNHVKLISTGILLAGLSACSTVHCNDYQSYRYVEAKAPVKVPADLPKPDNESVAPPVTINDRNNIHKRASGECLDKPPKI